MMRSGSDVTAKAVMAPPWLSNAVSSARVSASQMRTFPSLDPVTMRVGPDIRASAVTGLSPAALSTPSSLPVSTSQMRAVPSSDAVTMRFPSGITVDCVDGAVMTSEHLPFEQRAASALEADGRGRPVLPALDLGILAVLVGQGFQGEKQAGPCVALVGFPARQISKELQLCEDGLPPWRLRRCSSARMRTPSRRPP